MAARRGPGLWFGAGLAPFVNIRLDDVWRWRKIGMPGPSGLGKEAPGWGGQGMTLSTSVHLYDFCATFGSCQIPEKPLRAKRLTIWSRG